MADDVLQRLADTIHARASASADASYTRQLLDGGVERCAKKLGEEAVETIIAALGASRESLKGEAADLLYHLLVVLECRSVPLSEVLDILQQRAKISGLAEKASRAAR